MPKKIIDGQIREIAHGTEDRLQKHVRRFINQEYGYVIGEDGVHSVEWALYKLVKMRCAAKKISAIRIEEEFGGSYNVPIENATQYQLLNFAYAPQNQALRLMKPWDDPGVVNSLFANIVSASDLNKLQIAFEQWDKHMDNILTSLKVAHNRVKETIEKDSSDREQPGLILSIGLAVAGMVVNAFGLSPLMGLINTNISFLFNNSGTSWYQQTPSVSMKSKDIADSLKIGIQGLDGLNINPKDRNNSVSATLSYELPDLSKVTTQQWRNAGADEMSQAGVRKLVDLATDSLIKTIISSDKLPGAMSNQEFSFFLDQIRDMFRKLRVSVRESLDKLHRIFQERRYCLDFAQSVIIGLIQNGNDDLVEYYIVRNKVQDLLVEGLLKPTRKLLNEDLSVILQCPVSANILSNADLVKELERFLWAKYFSANERNLMTQNTYSTPGTHVEGETVQRANNKLGDVVAERLVSLNIAERRTKIRWRYSEKNEAKRQEDLNHMRIAMQNYRYNPGVEMPSACRVKIGKSGSGRRDLADVIDWSSRYLFYVPMSAILGIDQSIQDNSVAALSLWTGKDYRNLAEQVNKKTKPQVQSRPNETGSVS